MELSYPYKKKISTQEEAEEYILNQCENCPRRCFGQCCSNRQTEICAGKIIDVAKWFF